MTLLVASRKSAVSFVRKLCDKSKSSSFSRFVKTWGSIDDRELLAMLSCLRFSCDLKKPGNFAILLSINLIYLAFLTFRQVI